MSNQRSTRAATRQSSSANSAEKRADGRPAGYDALPGRFKSYITELERKVHAFEALHAEQPETNVWIDSYAAPPRYLPDDARILFKLASGKIEVQLDRRRGDKGVSIGSPDGRLELLPEISNEVGVRVGRY